MFEGHFFKKFEDKESDFFPVKEKYEERLDPKEVKKRIFDILFGNDIKKTYEDMSARHTVKQMVSESHDEKNNNQKDLSLGKTEVEGSEENKENLTDELKELSFEEINELQKKAIQEAFERIKRGEELEPYEKGNLGEMLMDQYYISQGYIPIHKPRVIDLKHKSGQGIDGVYEKINSDGTKSYVIGEAKVNASKLHKGLSDGTDQMSDEWVENRLDKSVGKEKADEIRDAFEDNSSSISKEVYRFSYTDSADIAKSDVSKVDENGRFEKNNTTETVQIFNKDGSEIEGGTKNDQR